MVNPNHSLGTVYLFPPDTRVISSSYSDAEIGRTKSLILKSFDPFYIHDYINTKSNTQLIMKPTYNKEFEQDYILPVKVEPFLNKPGILTGADFRHLYINYQGTTCILDIRDIYDYKNHEFKVQIIDTETNKDFISNESINFAECFTLNQEYLYEGVKVLVGYDGNTFKQKLIIDFVDNRTLYARFVGTDKTHKFYLNDANYIRVLQP